jgi:hypothetical protein
MRKSGGYELDDFVDGFSHYLPGLASATQLQPTPDVGSDDVWPRLPASPVADPCSCQTNANWVFVAL